MFDVFTEEIEGLIKRGLSNLYWLKDDLKKAWLRSGVDSSLCEALSSKRNPDGSKPSRWKLMDSLYMER